MILPSGRLSKKGPDWFLVDTEACGGGTLDLSPVLLKMEYLRIYRAEREVGGLPRGP
jgi:hypothetical protein